MTVNITPTDDQQQILNGSDAVFLVNAEGDTTHLVVPIDEARRVFGEYVRRELRVGFDQADRGEFVDWDPEEIKAEGRKRRQQRAKDE